MVKTKRYPKKVYNSSGVLFEAIAQSDSDADLPVKTKKGSGKSSMKPFFEDSDDESIQVTKKSKTQSQKSKGKKASKSSSAQEKSKKRKKSSEKSSESESDDPKAADSEQEDYKLLKKAKHELLSEDEMKAKTQKAEAFSIPILTFQRRRWIRCTECVSSSAGMIYICGCL